MKRLLSLVIAIIAIVAFAVPAFAAIPADVTVGTDGTAPYMIALASTPDECVEPGVQVYPEFAKPNADGSFPPTDPCYDGWKLVKFYVEVGHTNGIQNIDNVAIDVNYPESFCPEDEALFASRAGTLKFEINVGRNGESNTGWSAQIVYPYAEVYPGNVAATVPALQVRELVFGSTSAETYDQVDVDADGIYDGTDSPPDLTWQSFLSAWGSNVVYGDGLNAALAFDRYQLGQALVLEISGWMWFHQPGVCYPVMAKAATLSGATSESLMNHIDYQRVIGMYVDFDCVNYGDVNVGGDTWAMGDRYLNTPQYTTIWNNGNSSAQVSVQSTKMVKDYTGDCEAIYDSIYYGSPAKTIEHFDAKLYYTNGTGTVVQLGEIDYLADASPAVICNDGSGTGLTGPVLLQSCRPAKIEFSVHPETGESQEAVTTAAS